MFCFFAARCFVCQLIFVAVFEDFAQVFYNFLHIVFFAGKTGVTMPFELPPLYNVAAATTSHKNKHIKFFFLAFHPRIFSKLPRGLWNPQGKLKNDVSHSKSQYNDKYHTFNCVVTAEGVVTFEFELRAQTCQRPKTTLRIKWL